MTTASIKKGVATSEFGMALAVIILNILNGVFGWGMTDAALLGADAVGGAYIGSRTVAKK